MFKDRVAHGKGCADDINISNKNPTIVLTNLTSRNHVAFQITLENTIICVK